RSGPQSVVVVESQKIRCSFGIAFRSDVSRNCKTGATPADSVDFRGELVTDPYIAVVVGCQTERLVVGQAIARRKALPQSSGKMKHPLARASPDLTVRSLY